MESATPKPGKFEVVIDKLVYGGWGLGRFQGKVVFVPFSVPGDRLSVRTVQEKKKFIRAEISEIVEAGPDRVEPRCTHFGRCGGCQWQHLEYARQVETKRRILEELFHHHFPATRSLNIGMQPSPQSYGYRSRARVHTHGSGDGVLTGFHRFQSDRIEDIDTCPLFRPGLNEALAAVRKSLKEGRYGAGPAEIEIACSQESETWGAAFVGSEQEGTVPQQNWDKEGSPQTAAVRRMVGEFVYHAPPSVFFQANDFLIGNLQETVQTLAMQTGGSSALDLFCGTGLFALPLSRVFPKVVAVENSPLAARLCAANAGNAGLENLQVVCADVRDWMKAVGSIAPPAFDLIVLDPPRTGVGPETMKRMREWAPEAILYVSCDPQTLCRDLSNLPAGDFAIDYVQGLDLFPHTYHFETVVRLIRR